MSSERVYETPTQADHVSAEDARMAATDFLLDHLGNQLVAGEPYLMVSAVRAVWIVPVQLAYVHTGTLGTVGVVAVDEETSQVVGWTPIPQMKTASRRLRETRVSDITEQFQSFITSSPTQEDL
jgi:hypothetical protein